MKVCIVTGGTVNHEFLKSHLAKQKYDVTIAVDHGADFFLKQENKPDYVVGDMDSMTEETKAAMYAWKDCEIRKYPSEKDETDTELGILLAMELGATEIMIFGATGTRLDHVLGNIHIMMCTLGTRTACYMVDETNRISLVQGTNSIRKDEQYGKYVSFLPWMGEVSGVSIEGMKYPLHDAILPYGKSLGVSNEIVAEVATVTIGNGVAVMIESKDEEYKK